MIECIMYKFAGVGLIGFFIIMIVPANIGLTDTTAVGESHYGFATLVVHDANGNERFRLVIVQIKYAPITSMAPCAKCMNLVTL